jgi:extracellular elastinolytic metalloproteinase
MRFRFVVLAGLAAAALVLPGSSLGIGRILDSHEGLADADNRVGQIAPTAEQLARVKELGATARFNELGTVQSLTKYGGYLATGLSPNAVQAARQFVADNRVLFRLTQAGLDGLQLYSDAPLAGKDAGHVVVLRQKFGAQPALLDGQITVGVNAGRVYYVSSRAAGDGNAPGGASLGAAAAWVAAANDAGLPVSLAQVRDSHVQGGWTVLDVAGFGVEQRARLGAVPTPGNGVVAAYETLVVPGGVGKDALNVHGAYRSFVNAQNGAILVRLNIAENLAQASVDQFNGSAGETDGACGPDHGPYTAPANTKSIDLVATADLPLNDVVLHLLDANHQIVASQDTASSPEAIHYEPDGGVQAGNYFVRVCDFADGAAWTPPTTYTGSIAINDVSGSDPAPYPPEWKVFPASPQLGNQSFPYDMPSTDSREIWCWEKVASVPECQREVRNAGSRTPWDFHPTAEVPTFTTVGNNARSAEAWMSPLTPGPFGFRPVDAVRHYIFDWKNTWFEQKCAPTAFQWPAEPDLPAAVTNLFAMHNRMHDWSYLLGFTEQHWNSQDNNFGSTTLQPDALLGDTQAGGVSGGPPSYLGRDNANMVPLPDGVHPITNMYLWQPVAGAFYAPCVDGDFDQAVIGHEYGHLIENRMIGKGGTRAGAHAGAMGESFGDFDAVEYLSEVGFVPVGSENPFAVGAYVTGNHDRAIRNFNMSWESSGDVPKPGATPHVNPLNFGNVGYDLTGPQVHADGEIWSATQFTVRQALVDKYNGQFPYGDKALQEKCAFGSFADDPDQCPGNRRWIQLYYDAMVLMPVGPSMLDARDAVLAADQNRFGGANQRELWKAYASRGFGEHAVSAGNSDPDPVPNFESAVTSNEATIKFRARTPDGAAITNAKVYVGWYEDRTSQIADTDPANDPGGETNLDDTARFVAGQYELVVAAPGYGHFRFRQTFKAGQNRTVTLTLPQNLASASNGATASGDGANLESLIDDTEATNWESIDHAPVGDVDVVVDLAGDAPARVTRLQLSAMLQPGQNRFTALRAFEIWACTASAANLQCSVPPLGYTKVYTSPADFFPANAPRPVSPELLLREVTIPRVDATHIRLVVVSNQCTGGPDFAGEQDDDPLNATDCATASASADDVRAAELQVFSRGGGSGAAGESAATGG